MTRSPTTPLMPGQWIEPRRPKPEPTLAQRLVDAINKGRHLAELAAEVQALDLDLTDHTIAVLRDRLAREIAERQDLSRALQAVSDRRAEP